LNIESRQFYLIVCSISGYQAKLPYIKMLIRLRFALPDQRRDERNPIVHEGAALELDHPEGYAFQIDWDALPLGIEVDSDHSRVILGG
jgi:hypothetical protein